MVEGFGTVAVAKGESGGGEVVVGEVETHAGSGGDAEDFVEILKRAAGEQGERQVLELPRPAEEVDGLVEVVGGFVGVWGVGSA
jgi:hypothetical protein